MKNQVKAIAVIIVLFLTAASCKKERTTVFKTYFYSIDTASEMSLQLYVDSVFKGTLPYIKATPDKPLSTTDPVLIANALKLDLLSGHRYSIIGKRTDGTIVVAGNLTFSSTGNNDASVIQGGMGCNIEGANMGVYLWQ